MKKYRKYSSEFKRNLIMQIDNGQFTAAEAARENHLSPSLIDKWRKQIHDGTFQDKPTAREKQLEKERDQYMKKVGELTLQIDLLKKLNEYMERKRKLDGSVITGRKSEASEGGVK